MKIIVDANIVFSGILNTGGKIANILINPGNKFEFIAPDYLRKEIQTHYSRLIKYSGLTLTQIREAEFQICKDITFISEELINKPIWLDAEKLVVDIDLKDVHYVAFAKYFRCKIWSGDKALMKGLAKKDFNHFISTDELYRLLEEE